uniref:Uncharacterized protein n=1 Tax=Leersia perrieri TaxID=77586 RepID=A0A0D9WNX9_9ORYZ
MQQSTLPRARDIAAEPSLPHLPPDVDSRIASRPRLHTDDRATFKPTVIKKENLEADFKEVSSLDLAGAPLPSLNLSGAPRPSPEHRHQWPPKRRSSSSLTVPILAATVVVAIEAGVVLQW